MDLLDNIIKALDDEVENASSWSRDSLVDAMSLNKAMLDFEQLHRKFNQVITDKSFRYIMGYGSYCHIEASFNRCTLKDWWTISFDFYKCFKMC